MSERPAFNVAQLLKEPFGATRHGVIDARLEDLVPDLKDGEAVPDQPEMSVSGDVRLMHTTGGVLVQGDLEANVVLQCSRCLEPVEVPLDVPIEETFAQTVDLLTGKVIEPEEDDRALWIDEHHILDMGEVLRQDILVALPLHVLCRPDCKGLCPTCGKNLNEGPCDCQAEIDPRWAQLTDLLRNNHEVSSDSDKE